MPPDGIGHRHAKTKGLPNWQALSIAIFRYCNVERGFTAIIWTGTGLPFASTRPGLMVCVSLSVLVLMKWTRLSPEVLTKKIVSLGEKIPATGDFAVPDN